MKSIVFGAIFLVCACFFVPVTRAAATSFNVNLALNGVQSAADVKVLQQFLKDQGLFTADITGNFYTQTYKAVIAFQKREAVAPASGYWGPLTRAKANQILSVGAMSASAPNASGVSISDAAYQELQSQLASAWAQVQRLQDLIARYRSQKATATPTIGNPTTVSSTNSGRGAASGSSPVNPTGASGQGGSSTTAAPTTSATNPPPPPPSQPTSAGIPWGAYTGDTLSDLSALETLVGKNANIQTIFWGWNDTFPTTFNALGSGKTLVIYWEPTFDYDTINNGGQDAYITSFARGAETYAKSHKFILVPFDEMNLGEEVWGDTGNNTPAKFVTAWKHIHDLFVQQGAADVKWGLAYNSVSSGPHPNFADYYPGNAYVDYVGVTGFNFGNPSQSASAIFSPAIAKVEGYGKPVYIFSVASAAGSDKASWISDFGSYIKTIPGLQGFIWFNVNKERNWPVNSDPGALAAFTKII
jgi:hypothetical protein